MAVERLPRATVIASGGTSRRSRLIGRYLGPPGARELVRDTVPCQDDGP